MPREREPHDPSWIIAFDAHGNDLALQAEVAAMSDDERAKTEENVRAFLDEVRPTLRPRSR